MAEILLKEREGGEITHGEGGGLGGFGWLVGPTKVREEEWTLCLLGASMSFH